MLRVLAILIASTGAVWADALQEVLESCLRYVEDIEIIAVQYDLAYEPGIQWLDEIDAPPFLISLGTTVFEDPKLERSYVCAADVPEGSLPQIRAFATAAGMVPLLEWNLGGEERAWRRCRLSGGTDDVLAAPAALERIHLYFMSTDNPAPRFCPDTPSTQGDR